jgi:hypothetical protein
LIAFIEKVVVPYKNDKIAELKLPATNKTVLKLDLHYSHHDKEVLAFMSLHNIIPFFVPGRCTDVLQECDTVLNFPFKGGIRDAFRDYLHSAFNEYLVDKPEDFALWSPDLGDKELKKHVSGWVQNGIARCKTDEMRQTIKKAFANDGCFTEIRRRAAIIRQDAANLAEDRRQEIAATILALRNTILAGENEEEELEEMDMGDTIMVDHAVQEVEEEV